MRRDMSLKFGGVTLRYGMGRNSRRISEESEGPWDSAPAKFIQNIMQLRSTHGG